MNSVFKSSRALSLAAQTALVIGGSMALPALSHAAPDSGYTQYRCVVLNQSDLCPATPAVPATRVQVETVPGPYAAYLKHLGQDSATAIATARGMGEVATLRTVQVDTRQLSALELHEKYLGHLSAPETTYKTLAEAPVEEPTAQSRADMARKSSY